MTGLDQVLGGSADRHPAGDGVPRFEPTTSRAKRGERGRLDEPGSERQSRVTRPSPFARRVLPSATAAIVSSRLDALVAQARRSNRDRQRPAVQQPPGRVLRIDMAGRRAVLGAEDDKTSPRARSPPVRATPPASIRSGSRDRERPASPATRLRPRAAPPPRAARAPPVRGPTRVNGGRTRAGATLRPRPGVGRGRARRGRSRFRRRRR